MNVLFIGNSFSQDVTRYLREISSDALYVRNLYIGGCSLETHWSNFCTDAFDYDYQADAESIGKASIKSALSERAWDVISLQQRSGLSGIKESYEPYLTDLIREIKILQPKARIVFNMTWAYESGSEHADFASYDNDRVTMFSAIKDAVSEVSKINRLEVIPCGIAVEEARFLDFFFAEERRITRDGFHMSLDYGRYLTGLVCYAFLTGRSACNVEFEPEGTLHEINTELKIIADKANKGE